MKKILGITTIRSDYDLMSGVYRILSSTPDVDFRLLVGGAHLSQNYGHSVSLIQKDGFSILAEIECLIDGDSPSSRLKTAAIFLQDSIAHVSAWKPDLILFAGDREDVLVASMIGLYLGIPTVHFFGGDHEQDGHADTLARHAASKMATLHIVSIEEHARRLVRMGEESNRICVAGSVALDKFVQHKPWSFAKLMEHFPKGKKMDGFALMIHHPLDAEREHAHEHFENIIEELLAAGIPVCGSYPNTDPGNHSVIEVIRKYENHQNCWFYKNLDREWFLSLFKASRFLIGNSSAGILEAASVPVAAINVGRRQLGRLSGPNVVFCQTDRQSIRAAIKTVGSDEFSRNLVGMNNPYGDGKSCEHAVKFILGIQLDSIRAKTIDPLTIPLMFNGN